MPDFYTAKYTPSGTLVWLRKLYSNSAFDNIYSIATDASDNVYVTGFSDASGDQQLLIARYDSGGDLAWMKHYGGGSFDHGYSVAVDSTGAIYVAGKVQSAGPAQSNMLLVKYNVTSGALVWQRILGSAYSDEARGIAIDSSDNIYITGQTYSTDTSSTMIVTAKYDSDGTLIWQVQLDGAQTQYGISIDTDSSNNVYVAGISYAGSGPSDEVAIVKYNSAGSLQWQRILGSTGSENPPGIAIDSDGNVCIATGTYVGSPVKVLVAKLPSDGTLTGTYGSFTYATTTYTAAAATLTDSTPSLSSADASLTPDSSPSYTTPTAAFVATVINM